MLELKKIKLTKRGSRFTQNSAFLLVAAGMLLARYNFEQDNKPIDLKISDQVLFTDVFSPINADIPSPPAFVYNQYGFAFEPTHAPLFPKWDIKVPHLETLKIDPGTQEVPLLLQAAGLSLFAFSRRGRSRSIEIPGNDRYRGLNKNFYNDVNQALKGMYPWHQRVLQQMSRLIYRS